MYSVLRIGKNISAKALLSPVMLPCTSAPKATFQKTRDKKDRLVDTPAFTNKDEIALDYKLIQRICLALIATIFICGRRCSTGF